MTERGRATKELLELESRYGARNYKPLPVVLTRGESIWVYDVEGNRYLDCLACYSAVNHGHRHPRIIEALKKQADELTLTSRAFFNDQLGPFLKDLTEYCDMEMALPMNTGAEAVETAVKACRRWGYRVKGIPEDEAEIIVCEGNFHGRTTTVISFSSEDKYRKDFGPHTPGFKIVPFGDASALAEAITDRTCAFLLEPIQGEGGDNHFRPSFLKRLKNLAHENDALLVFDEVQSGVGITGHFWAHQAVGVKPDILSFGKKSQVCGILAGHKLDEVDGHVFDTPSRINSTWGGNIVDMVRFDRILEIMEDEHLVQHAGEVGQHLQARLHELADHYPAVTNVRGEGLMTAFTLPSTEYRNHVKEQTYEEGAIILGCGESSIRFRTPLTITKDEVDEGVACIRRALETVAAEHPDAAH